jgi:hypothetical protein
MPTTAVLTQDCERLNTSTPPFRLSLAQNIHDLTACQRHRSQVFNCELGEGFDPAFRTIDFLTLVDLHRIPDRVRARFF